MSDLTGPASSGSASVITPLGDETAVPSALHDGCDPHERTAGGDNATASADGPVESPETAAAAWEAWGRRALSIVVVGACCLYVFLIVHGPTLVLSKSTPTGGDMGAHVWGPAYLRDHLLPNLRLTGWTQDWYAGFPAYTFYMVLPSLLIVGLDVGLVPMDRWWGQAIGVLLAVGLFAGWWRIRGRFGRVVRALSGPAAILAFILLVDVPYNVAFKLVVIAGIVAFPAGIWYLLSGLSLRQPGPELGAIASVAFLMDRSLFHIYGGNIASTMAGEFAFSLSITLALFALGAIARGLATGRHRTLAAVLIAASALCHVIPAFFLFVGAFWMLVLRPTKRAVKWAFPVGITGTLLAMWWYIPFFFQSDYLNDMGWEKLGVIRCNNVNEWSWNEVFRNLKPFAPHIYTTCGGPGATPQTFTDPDMLHGRVFFILAALGAVMSLVMVVRAGIWLSIMTAVSAAAFVLMPQHRFWNARVLPFYYLSIYLLAAVGLYLAIRAVSLVVFGRWRHVGIWASMATLGAAALVMVVALNLTFGALPGITRVPAENGQPAKRSWLGLESSYEGVGGGWAKWNFEGLESKPGTNVDPATGITTEDTSSSREFFAMVQMMRDVGADDGCGRAFWEYDSDLNKYGTPMAPMLLPYFTDGCIGSMEGLYFEASSTTPFHFMVQSELSQAPSRPQRFPSVGVNPEDAPADFNGSWPYRNFDLDQGIRHLQMLGVRYFMTYKDPTRDAARKDDRLRELATSGPWTVFEVSGVELVEVLPNLPNRWTNVEDNIHEWARPAVEWFSDRESWDVYRATDGPADWPAIRFGDEAVTRRAPAPDLKVSDIAQTEDSISFEVSEIGSPVLVKTSYFPNWDVSGADGPYRVAPNQMVVIPTARTVTLTYGRTGIEYIGWVLTLLGLVGLTLLFRWRWPAIEGRPSEFFGDRLDLPSGGDDDHRDPDGGEQLTIPFGEAVEPRSPAEIVSGGAPSPSGPAPRRVVGEPDTPGPPRGALVDPADPDPAS